MSHWKGCLQEHRRPRWIQQLPGKFFRICDIQTRNRVVPDQLFLWVWLLPVRKQRIAVRKQRIAVRKQRITVRKQQLPFWKQRLSDRKQQFPMGKQQFPQQQLSIRKLRKQPGGTRERLCSTDR